MRILGIETSCDETAAAVVEDGRQVRSSVVASQVKLHATYVGVVPELACPAHVELINPVVDAALVEAGILVAAAGVPFDKVATFPGLRYPGVSTIERLAGEGDPGAGSYTQAMLDEGYHFWFSGLKTAVVNHVRKHSGVATRAVAASFQEPV